MSPAATPGAGEVFDLGYRPYEGAREGRRRARRVIWRDGVRASVGIGRSTGQKILPFAFIAISLIPAVIVIVIAGFVSSFGGGALEGLEDFTNRSYYDFAFFPLLLFAATMAPELLCPDRRNGVIILYLVRPLTTVDYVAARWVAFATTMLALLWFPQLLVFLAQMLVAEDTGAYVVDHWDLFPRIAAAGACYATALTSFAFVAASLTDRRAYAAVGALAIVLISSAVSGIATDVLAGRDLAGWVELVGVAPLLDGVNDWIFGVDDLAVAGPWYAAALAGWVALAGAGVAWRYRGLGR